MITMSNREKNLKLEKIQNIIIDKHMDGCILTSPVNQFWLCGFIFDGYIYILPEGNPILFVKRPLNINHDWAVYLRKPEQITDMLSKMSLSLPKNILLETDYLTFNATARLKAALNVDEFKMFQLI